MGRPSREEPPRSAAIVAAALDVFLLDGYGASSVESIARRAGASKATVYRHFADKEALLEAVLKDASARAWDSMPPGDLLQGPPRAALNAFGLGILEALSRPTSVRLFRLVIAEAERFPALSRIFYDAITAQAVGALVTWLGERSATGELRVPDPELAALQLLGLFKEPTFWPRVMAGRQPRNEPAEVVARGVELFLHAHAPGSARASQGRR